MEILRKNHNLYENVIASIFLLGLAVVEFTNVEFYSDPVFDRAGSGDHLLAVMAFFIFVILGIIKIKNVFFPLTLALFVFGIGNWYADNFVLHYYTQFGYDYLLPVSCAVILVYFRKVKLKKLIQFIVTLCPIYFAWHYFPSIVDCSHMFLKQCAVSEPYFWNWEVNLFIISVWVFNFILAWFLFTKGLIMSLTEKLDNCGESEIEFER